MNSITKHFSRITAITDIKNASKIFVIPALNAFHTSRETNAKWNKQSLGPKKWLLNNKIIHPPQKPEEEPRKGVRCLTYYPN